MALRWYTTVIDSADPAALAALVGDRPRLAEGLRSRR